MFLKSKMFSLIIFSCFTFALVSCVGVTSAYYIFNSDVYQTEIVVGEDVSVSVTQMQVADGANVLPGEKVNMKAVTIGTSANSTDCYVRVKIETVGANANNLILNSTQEGLENQVTLVGGNGYNWVYHNGYYYLTADQTINENISNLYEVQKNQTFSVQITDVLVNDNLTLDNASQQTEIKLSVQAIQSRNYVKEAWAYHFE